MKQRKELLLCALITLIFIAPVFAQSEDWQGYTATYEVEAILEDGDVMWLGTMGGLVKYDLLTGEKEVYNTANSGLNSNFVISLAKDDEGNLWVGTSMYVVDHMVDPYNAGGLHKLTPEGEWTLYTSNNSPLPANGIKDISFDNEGNAWISVWNHGVVRLSPEDEWDHFLMGNVDLSSDRIIKVFVDSSGDIWFGGFCYYDPVQQAHLGGGVSKYSDGEWTNYFDIIPNNHGYVNIMDIDEDSEGNMWFAGSYNGYYIFDGDVFTQLEPGFSNPWRDGENMAAQSSQNKVEDDFRRPGRDYLYNPNKTVIASDISFRDDYTDYSGPIQAVRLDSDDNLWLGTGAGAAFYDGEEWHLYNNHNTVIGEYYISGLHIDVNGTVWIMSAFYGLFTYTDGVVEEIDTLDPNSGMPCVFIYDVAVDESGTVWAGSGLNILNNGTGGLVNFDGDQWGFFGWDIIDTWLVNDITIKDGSVYLATGNDHDLGGAVEYDGSNWTILNNQTSGYPLWAAHSVVVDGRNTIWVGVGDMNGGLLNYDDGVWTHYNASNSGLYTNVVYALAVDPTDDAIWVGTAMGLFRFDGVDWQAFHPGNTPAFAGAEIWSLYFDENNVLWVGYDMGLTSYDGTEWTNHNSILPILPDGYVTPVSSTTQDEYGRHWFGTVAGLIMKDGEDTEIYNISNSALPTNYAYKIDTDGRGKIWIGTSATGLYSFEYPHPTSGEDLTIPSSNLTARNYPNPFNPETTIEFSIKDQGRVSVEIFNVKGQKIKQLTDDIYTAGTHTINWNGTDHNGNVVASGIYFYKVNSKDATVMNKAVLLK